MTFHYDSELGDCGMTWDADGEVWTADSVDSFEGAWEILSNVEWKPGVRRVEARIQVGLFTWEKRTVFVRTAE